MSTTIKIAQERVQASKEAMGIPSVPSRLPEFSRYEPRAGHPDWASLMEEVRASAAQLRPQLERPQGGLALWERRWAAYRTTFQNYRLNRAFDRVGREDLRPLYFIWTMLRTCNFACEYCDDHRGNKYPDLPNKGVLDTEEGIALLRIMRTRTPSVYFAGGEPMLRKDLPVLTRAARDLDYFPIIINTNGSLLRRRLLKDGWRTWLADMDIVIVSLDALDLVKLRDMWVTRRPNEVFAGLLLLRELAAEMNVKLMVNCVIQPGYLDEAAHVLDFANDMGIWFTPVPVNVGPTVEHSLHKDPAYAALVETILERKREGLRITGSLRMNRRLLNSEPLDCRNAIKPHIDFDGTLLWPCKATVNVEPARLNVLDFPDVDALYERAVEEIDPAGFHGPGPLQCGANCNWAQNYSTDAYLHGLRHPMSLLRDVGEFLSR